MGNNFAVSATSFHSSGYEIYRPFATGTTHTTCWASSNSDAKPDYIWYNPNPLNVSKIEVRNRLSGNNAIAYPITGTIYGSNNNTDWEEITTYSNAVTAAGAWWEINLDTTFFKLYKFHVETHQNSSYTCIQTFNLTSTAKI